MNHLHDDGWIYEDPIQLTRLGPLPEPKDPNLTFAQLFAFVAAILALTVVLSAFVLSCTADANETAIAQIHADQDALR